ncbi:hypothetical protein D3C86_1090060 [compost metagenome]
MAGKFPFDQLSTTFTYQDPPLIFEFWGVEHDLGFMKPFLQALVWIGAVGLIVGALIAL